MKLTRFNQLIKDGKAIDGRWQLTHDHEVQYESEGLDEELKFKGSLIAAEPDALVISVTERQSDQKIVTSLVKLRGNWHVNPKNQIIFEVEKESGKNDIFTFRSGWKVNDRNEIIYTYRQENLKTKIKQTQELAFTGYWEISEKNRLTYYIGGDSGSSFRFRGTFQSKSILAKRGEIRYQIGAEVSGKRRVQTVSLFGKWKVSRDLSLDFEMSYQDGNKIITFGGEYNLGGSRQIAVNLKTEQGAPLGVEVILTQDIFGKDGQFFIRLEKALAETSLEAGVEFKW